MDLKETSQRATIAYIVSVVLFFVVLAIAMNFLAKKTSIGLAYAISWLGLFGVFGIFFLLDKNQAA